MVGKEQVVLLAKGIEFTAEGILPSDVVALIFVTLNVFAGTRQFAVFFNAGKFATGIADEGKLFIGFGVNVIQFAVEIPMVIDGVIEFGKNIRLFVFFAVSVGAKITLGGQVEIEAATHRYAVEIRRFLRALVHSAEAEGGAVAKVGFQYAVEGAVVTRVFFLPVFVAAGNANDATAQGLRLVETAGEIASAPYTLPKRSACRLALACVAAVGFLRTALMVPPGSPLDWVSPVAPRTTSMWS